MSIAVLNPRGDGLVAGEPEQVWTGAKWTEGPCVLGDGSLLFSDIPNNRILRCLLYTSDAADE